MRKHGETFKEIITDRGSEMMRLAWFISMLATVKLRRKESGGALWSFDPSSVSAHVPASCSELSALQLLTHASNYSLSCWIWGKNVLKSLKLKSLKMKTMSFGYHNTSFSEPNESPDMTILYLTTVCRKNTCSIKATIRIQMTHNPTVSANVLLFNCFALLIKIQI